jgi:hypothetical protein
MSTFGMGASEALDVTRSTAGLVGYTHAVLKIVINYGALVYRKSLSLGL